ncbi:D-alanyl-D-alanine carboxypeptidase (penicillin-binding protein 5/6) [Microbacterium sp. SLBN-154]|uniref:D-alanyl-D-alanine carboxypeptidase family protein n=1 Tax=Microbacterium sp. SLBN-154 TaxID=2768458 RepID=UPI00114E1AA3|nr:D-alanyl-D-alanine carboxypeptidase [Microbacterium sp. SLBN-154]TQK20891.1 D-alanyl-D-alanine carboxypeptidase (penicillin-binding protein 5/6) [Microbacterium sp. SLBN-154]
MAEDDRHPLTRRALRRHPGETDAAESPSHAGVLTAPGGDAAPSPTRSSLAEPSIVAESRHPTALTWVDESAILARPPGFTDLSGGGVPYVPVGPDLLAGAPRRSIFRPGVLLPAAVILGLVGGYAATTGLWPLYAVTPEVEAVQVLPAAAPAAAPVWPAEGSAAVAVEGIGGPVASSADRDAIASITKVVTSLVVLDELQLGPGEPGPEFRFTGRDSDEYWDYLAGGESALDVPVGGTLSMYQMLEGILIGSANNYADRLASYLYPTDAVFANAAASWLDRHGIDGITIVEPTGIDERNSASSDALIPLAQRALANPVVAEIVAKQAVELPGAGLVTNTNGLLADPGVVGIKTGTLDRWSLLSAKSITVAETPITLYAAVLGQPDDEARLAASRALYAQLEAELQPTVAVPAGTTAGYVRTAWGEDVPIVTTADAAVIAWNGGSATVESAFDLDDLRAEGDTVGALTATGALDESVVGLELAQDVEDPSFWWRLTHPLELFGLTG